MELRPFGHDVGDKPAVVVRLEVHRPARRVANVDPVAPHITGEPHVEQVLQRPPANGRSERQRGEPHRGRGSPAALDRFRADRLQLPGELRVGQPLTLADLQCLAGLSNRCGDLPLLGGPSLQHGDRPGGRSLPATLGCNPAAPLRARSRSVRGRQGPAQELSLHVVVALPRQLVRRGGPGRSTRSGSRPGSPDRIGRAWSQPSTAVYGSEAARGLADARLGPNGPPSRDVRPQRPLTPHGKAEDTNQPAKGGGDWR